MDYTEDKINENEEYPRSHAVSASKRLCPTLVEIVKHVFELLYTKEDILRLEPLRPQQT